QDELAAAAARLQPAVQRGAGATDVQVAGGAGGKTGSTGHGANFTRQPPVGAAIAAMLFRQELAAMAAPTIGRWRRSSSPTCTWMTPVRRSTTCLPVS